MKLLWLLLAKEGNNFDKNGCTNFGSDKKAIIFIIMINEKCILKPGTNFLQGPSGSGIDSTGPVIGHVSSA
jgi:hypothetical protein